MNKCVALLAHGVCVVLVSGCAVRAADYDDVCVSKKKTGPDNQELWVLIEKQVTMKV